MARRRRLHQNRQNPPKSAKTRQNPPKSTETLQNLQNPPKSPKSLNNPKSLDKIHKIEAKDIVFKFDHHSEKNILNNISFKVSSNQILGIIGPPGSGKSSLAQLIPRFYDIQEGSLTINDIDIRNIDITELRNEVGIISQNTFLFNMTIKENISYGAPNSEMDEIIKCAQIAEIHDFIESLPEKYETTVGEFGVSLSGGQKQRISIARTLLKKPSLIIFDDSLSALDSITDKKDIECVQF